MDWNFRDATCLDCHRIVPYSYSTVWPTCRDCYIRRREVIGKSGWPAYRAWMRSVMRRGYCTLNKRATLEVERHRMFNRPRRRLPRKTYWAALPQTLEVR